MKGVEFELEGLSVHRAVDRLLREGVPILSARMTAKNRIKIAINAADRKKTFAILHGSCYNMIGERSLGLMRLIERASRAVGLFLGSAAAILIVLFMQGRVLKIEVTGSGAYLEPEIRAALFEKGIGYFSAMPDGNTLIPDVLSLPRVHFVSVKGENGVLTVDVEVSDETQPLSRQPLFSPAGGKVEELTVLRGTAVVEIGQNVETGQEIVAPYALHGEEKRDCLVIARVKIAFPVQREYSLSEERARLQAFLDFGEIADLTMTETEGGWRVEGTGHAEGSVNFG